MVSVENIQKKNELSKELKEHGFAIDFGEAFEQADRIYSKKKASPDVSFAEESQSVVEEKVNDEAVEELKERIRILERKNKNAKKKNKEYEQKISKLVEKMNELVKNFNMVEMNQQSFQRQLNKVKKGKTSSSDSNPGEKEVEKESQQVSQQTPQQPSDSQSENSEEKITTPIDRNGVAPSEVSVEKIFYSGSDS